MARRDGPVDDGGALRRYLLGEAVNFRRRLVDICLADPAMAESAWQENSKPVDVLVGGEAYTLQRSDLPADHPARAQGRPGDLLVLGADDKLRLYDDVRAAQPSASA